jgi:hypothetical protein
MKRLLENEIVALGLPFRIRMGSPNAVDCVVLAISGRTASLEAIDKPAWARVPGEVEQVYMTFGRRSALVSLRGHLSTSGAVGEMRFAVTDGAHVRPDCPTRARVALPLTVSRLGSAESVEATTVDISTNGLLLDCDLDVAAGESLDCCLALPNRRVEAHVVARVVKIAAGGIAVTFDQGSATPDLQQALFELVTTQRRLEWHRGAEVAIGRPAHDL